MSPKKGVLICLYPVKEDIWVFGTLKSGCLYEEETVMQLQACLKRYPDMVFVDIGSNIGMYTIFAAAMGRKVLAVEMLPKNVKHTQVALRISGLGSEGTIVNNAIYSEHRVFTAKFEKQNVGGTSLGNKTTKHSAPKVHGTVYVHAIWVDDLIPLLDGALAYVKMDIENTEQHALRGARKFFQKVNVAVVQMEWLNRGKDEGLEILQFMNPSGYVLSMTLSRYTPIQNLNETEEDIYFFKQTNMPT